MKRSEMIENILCNLGWDIGEVIELGRKQNLIDEMLHYCEEAGMLPPPKSYMKDNHIWDEE